MQDLCEFVVFFGDLKMMIFWGGGAEGGTRTLTLSLAADFESAASTNSATSAKDLLIIKILAIFVNIKLQNCKAI